MFLDHVERSSRRLATPRCYLSSVIHLLLTILVLAAIAVLGGLVVAYPLSLAAPA